MRSSDSTGYRRQALEGLALILESLIRDHYFVDLTFPLPHDTRAGSQLPWGGLSFERKQTDGLFEARLGFFL